MVREKKNGIDGSWNFFLFSSEVQIVSPLNGRQMKSSIWNYRCPSIACHLWFNVCFSVKINTFSTHDLLVREFRSFLEPKICLRSCWLLDNCLFFGGISIFRLRQALQPLFLWQKNPKMMEYIFFSPFPRPSLNNDSLGPWGFAPYFHSGATFYPCSYLP